MADASVCLERSNVDLSIHIYGYNNVHDVIVYTVVKDMQNECGQPRHRFQKSQFWSIYTETQLKLKRGLLCFQKSQFSNLKTPQ